MGRNVLNLWEKYYDATFPIKEGDGFIILGIDSFTTSDAEAQLAQALEAVKPFHALKETVLNAESDEAKTDEEFAKKGDNVISELYQTAKSVDGNMSGEHGVGYARQNYYEDFYGKDYTDLLRKVKGLFDPKGILNPDKIFPLD